MITVNNLRKIYKSKKGSTCTAVDGVSISFPKKGMVFVVGKSGSGKSTLLNLLSGLDNADSGEIIVAGKNCKDFTPSDFDSYRNAYVGFIFQDFNVIDDLTVRENIELSLKLQNKKLNDEDLQSILETVDLVGLENRFPVELSGGQKQRICIARALVKQPKIIFADEPTGSLDSKTGKQVFETLKKISKTKLVITISHDTASALCYGDRIIELSDGKVVSDRKKIKKIDYEKINSEYQRKINQSFTNDAPLQKRTKQKDTYQRSKAYFSNKDALKLGLATFKQKKVKTAFTIVLTLMALTVFGIMLNMKNYNSHAATINTSNTLGIETFVLTNNKFLEEKMGFEEYAQINFEQDSLASVERDLGYEFIKASPFKMKINQYIDGGEQLKSFSLHVDRIVQFNDDINVGTLKDFYNAKLVCGDYPKMHQEEIEILISDFTAQSIMQTGAKFDNMEVLPNSTYEQIVGGKFICEQCPIKIVGVFSTDYANVDFEEDKSFRANFNLSNIYKTAISTKNGLYDMWLKQSGLINVVSAVGSGRENTVTYNAIVGEKEDMLEDYLGSDTSMFSHLFKFAPGYSINSVLADNEVVISFQKYVEIFEKYESNDLGEYTFTFDSFGDEDFENASFSVLNTSNNVMFSDNLKIVGIFDCSHLENNSTYQVMMLSESMKVNFVSKMETILTLYLPKNSSNIMSMLDYLDDRYIFATTYASAELKTFDRLFSLFSQILTLASIVMFILSALLLYNFISFSINDRQKDIGILRALGASGKDVTKIFLFEGLVMGIICYILSIGVIAIGCGVINNLLTQRFFTRLTIIQFEFLPIIVLGVTCFATIIIASGIPLFRLIKKRPIEVIRRA